MTKQFFFVTNGELKSPTDILGFAPCYEPIKKSFEKAKEKLKPRLYKCIEIARTEEDGSVTKTGDVDL